MLKIKKFITRILASTLLLALFSGCASTRTENGVSIEQKRSLKFW
ncbi:MAG: hypothetical protein ACN4GF_05520 [Lentimonas sp.]